MKLSEFIEKENVRNGGKWISVGEYLEGVRLKIRPLRNPDFERIAFESGSTASQDRDYNLTIEQNAKLIAESILVDWSGFEDDDGQPLPFSKEKALELARSPNLWRLRERILSEALILADANLSEIDAAAKN